MKTSIISTIIFVLVATVPVSSLKADVPSDPIESATWKDRVLANVAHDAALPPQEAIPLLGDRIYSLVLPWNKSSDSIEVIKDVKTRLTAIPGHAEYYRERVLAAQAAHRDDLNSILAGTKHNNYVTEQSLLRRTLSQLPSVETVRVLGELLSDEWVQPGAINIPIEDRISPMSLVAVRTLSQLPLANKPAQTVNDSDADRDLRIWQLWYEQIKAGNRTFRFEGDPTEYDLNGPASKEQLQRVDRDRKRDDERATGNKRTSSITDSSPADIQPSNPFSIAGLIAGCLISAFAVWHFMKRSQHSR